MNQEKTILFHQIRNLTGVAIMTAAFIVIAWTLEDRRFLAAAVLPAIGVVIMAYELRDRLFPNGRP